jgi:hypothetical protein
MRVPLKKVLPFVALPGGVAGGVGGRGLDRADLAARLRPAPRQASVFDEPAAA